MYTSATDPVDGQPLPVDVRARVVPSGVYDGSLWVTLALRPAATQSAGTADLKTWPSDIDKRFPDNADPALQGQYIEMLVAETLDPSRPLTPEQCGTAPRTLKTGFWVTRKDKGAAQALWSSSMPTEGADWRKLHEGLQALDQPASPTEPCLPVCSIAGRQGELVVLTKMLRAIETVQLAIAEHPEQRVEELASVALEAAKKFLRDHPELGTLYPDKDPDPKLPPPPPGEEPTNLDQTKKKRDYALRLMPQVIEACDKQKAIGASTAGKGTISEAVRLLMAGLRDLRSGLVCALLSKEHAADIQIDGFYRRLFELRQHFLFAAALDEDVLADLEAPITPEEPTVGAAANAQWALDNSKETARARFAALEESPDLGRLFRCFVDLRLEKSELLTQLPKALIKANAEIFVFFRVSPALLSQGPERERLAHWTLCKIRLSEDGKDVVSFLSATREELYLAQAKSSKQDMQRVLSQMDGVYLLGAEAIGGDPGPQGGLAALRLPAYDLISADLRAAAQEADSRTDLLLSQAARNDLDAGPARRAKSALRSGGLSVVGFSVAARLSRTIGCTAELEQQICVESFLDAEDLSMGRLPLLAIQKDGEPVWHILTRRKITFGEGDKPEVDKLIDALWPGGSQSHNSPRRLAQAATDRSAPRVFSIKDPNTETRLFAAPDAAELTFLGDPMGIETGRDNSVEEITDDSPDLPIDREIALLDASGSPGTGVAPLRFGLPLTAAFAAVYLGGAVLPPTRRESSGSSDTLDHVLARIPTATAPRKHGSTPPQGRRYLRSEPVPAPQVLLTKAEADADVASYTGFSPPKYSPQTTGHVVLRFGSKPDQLTRIVLPPVVSLDMAECHGAFDKTRPRCFPGSLTLALPIENVSNVPLYPGHFDDRGTLIRPRDGLRDIHFDCGFGGYPLLHHLLGGAADRVAIIGARFEEGKNWLKEARRRDRAIRANPGADEPPTASPTGDAVFASRGIKTVDQGRTIPFYPDPMASSLVVRLRTGPDPMSRDSVDKLFVPFVEAEKWPDLMPVALEIRKADTGEGPVLESKGTVIHSGRTCRRIIVRLRPGMSGTLDLWAIPSVDQLAQWSELVDTAAGIDCYPTLPVTDLPSLRGCGILGSDAPCPDRLKVLAARLRAELETHPLPELSEVRSIAITHATRVPQGMPVLGSIPLELRRVKEQISTRSSNRFDPPLLEKEPLSLPAGWNPDGLDANAEPDATKTDLAGFVGIDLASVGGLEITASAIAPFGADFDDVGRGRSRNDVNSGNGGDKVIDPKTGLLRDPQDFDIYGFHISPRGRVRFRSSEQLWARFANLPLGLKDVDPDRKTWIALHALFAREPIKGAVQSSHRVPGADPFEAISTDIKPLFTDTRARKVRIGVKAISRHMSAFAERPMIVAGEYLHGREPDPEKTVKEVPVLDGPIVWLPASARPAVPVAAAQAIPIIAEEVLVLDRPYPTVIKRRLTEVRLWLARPWFTSGEDERLGIVLWPRLSRLARRGVLGVHQDTLYERPSLDASKPAIRLRDDFMVLDRFEDRYLTGAAQYVTRWGSDPVEAFPVGGWREWTVPTAVFCDFKFDVATGRVKELRDDALFVPKLAMPIPETRTGAEGDLAAQKRQRYLNVDLLTYEPRFDIDREQWYVDVRLDPQMMIAPFLRLGIVRYQKHAPRDLQVSMPGEPFELQLLTRRETRISLRAEPNDQNRMRIEVFVDGPATLDIAPVTSVDARADLQVKTRMLLRLQGISRDSGQPRVAAELEVANQGPGRGWRGCFVVPRRVVDDPSLDLTVHVEERAYRPPTSYSEQYFADRAEYLATKDSYLADKAKSDRMPSEDMHLTKSPRYLCSLDVPRAGAIETTKRTLKGS